MYITTVIRGMAEVLLIQPHLLGGAGMYEDGYMHA
jgi:hypothetical protein